VVYPNPATDYLFFDIRTSDPSAASVSIYNNLGILVQQSDPYHLAFGKNVVALRLEKIDQPGIYLYKILLDNAVAYTGRFVKL
jgi:hypothetical protein